MFVLLVSGAINKKEFSLLSYYSGEYYCYSNISQENSVNLGTCYMSVNPTKNKVGESLKINNFSPAQAIEEFNAKVVKTEYLSSGATVIYAYSNLIPEEVEIDGKQVNMQIAYYETYSVIGWPLILGSF